jgi:hypothetical protein
LLEGEEIQPIVVVHLIFVITVVKVEGEKFIADRI